MNTFAAQWGTNLSAESLCFPVAHLEFSDVPIAIVFDDTRIEIDRDRVYRALAAQFGPTAVALVWQDSWGRMQFIAPVEQRRFLEAMKYDQLLAQADGTVALTRS